MTDVRDTDAGQRGAFGIRLAVSWLVSIALVVGLWLALRYGLPAAFGADPAGDAVQRFRDGLDRAYWIVLALYLGLAAVLTPKYDPENLGLFGIKWIDNPFSLEDDYNRAARKWASFLAPGKFVWNTLVLTWAACTKRSRA